MMTTVEVIGNHTQMMAYEPMDKEKSSSQDTLHYKDWPNDLGFNHTPRHQTPIDLVATGKFPSWTAGTLLRNGPGQYKVERPGAKDGAFKISHWFDGFTTTHRFEILPEMNTVKYSSRGQVDVLLEKARQTGRLEGLSFGQKRDPCDSFYHKFKTFFTPPPRRREPGSLNIGVSFAPAHHVSDKNVVSMTTDASTLEEIRLDTLEPISLTPQSKLNPELKGPHSAAHPCHDPVTHDLFNYNLEMGMTHTYRVFRTKAKTGETDILATIKGSEVKGAYIHSLFITEHFVILCVWPAFFANMGLSILWERNLLDALAPFDKNAKCTWYVVDRISGRGVVNTFTSPAMFSFHSVNAWEETNEDGSVDILADICQFEDTAILHQFYYENLVSTNTGCSKFDKWKVFLVRYRLAKISLEKIHDEGSLARTAETVWSLPEPACGDLPVINRKYNTKPYRYVYSVINRGKSSFLDAVGKTDTMTGKCKLWACDKHTPGEPIFVPRPNAKDEDDGALLVVVLDGVKGTSYLLCLDAKNMTEIARAECDGPVSFGFHGVHLPNRPAVQNGG